jgi:hypothetical protein
MARGTGRKGDLRRRVSKGRGRDNEERERFNLRIGELENLKINYI